MQVKIPYNTGKLAIECPETPGFLGALEGREPEPLADVAAALGDGLARPIQAAALRELAAGKQSACIVISDITRPVPNSVLLPPILATLEEAGVPPDGICILIGTGIHRPNLDDELVRLVGAELAATRRIENHYSKRAGDMVDCGQTATGIPIFVNRHYVEAELKILTGFIEPHMWAGYSGGRKAILPGITSLETMKYMHSYEMVAHPNTTYGMLEGNPFHEAGLEVLKMVGADFLVNVTLDSSKRVTGVWCGDPVEAHLEGCRFLDDFCVVEVDAPLDFAVTTNAGAPLDCNLYQSSKGLTGAANIVRQGGAILIATACFESVGSPEYEELVDTITSAAELLDRLQQPGFFIVDQWVAQETYQVLSERRGLIYTDGVPGEKLKQYLFEPVESVEAGIRQLLTDYGEDARWAIIPTGPLTITRLRA